MKHVTPEARKSLIAILVVFLATLGTIGGIIFVFSYRGHRPPPPPPPAANQNGTAAQTPMNAHP